MNKTSWECDDYNDEDMTLYVRACCMWRVKTDIRDTKSPGNAEDSLLSLGRTSSAGSFDRMSDSQHRSRLCRCRRCCSEMDVEDLSQNFLSKCGQLYSLSQKTMRSTFGHNFSKSRPIYKILSLLVSWGNFLHKYCKDSPPHLKYVSALR